MPIQTNNDWDPLEEIVVGTAVAGQMYFDSTLKKAKVYNGVTWEALN